MRGERLLMMKMPGMVLCMERLFVGSSVLPACSFIAIGGAEIVVFVLQSLTKSLCSFVFGCCILMDGWSELLRCFA